MEQTKRQIICTCCPMGCHMEVTLTDGKVTEVIGNTCKRGAAYAEDECLCPKRTLTTTVKTSTGEPVSVKTASAIPFEKMTEAMKTLAEVTANVPVHIGDVIVADLCQTGVAVVATKNIG